MKNILITGAGGFIGSNLKESSLLKEKYNILAPDLSELDLTNSEKVSYFFNNNNIDYIIHSASIEMINKSYQNDVCEMNLRMFFNLIRSKKNECVIYSLCSGSIYSRSNWIPNMNESYFDQFVPIDGHSYSKYIINKFSKNNKNIVILRLFGIFGKYEDYKFKFISNSIAKNLLNMDFMLYKNTIYDYLYIDDFIDIMSLFIDKNINKGEFNITPDNSIELVNILKIINSISRYKSSIKIIDNGLGVEYTGSNKKMIEVLGSYIFTDYMESISELFEYMKNNTYIIKEELIKDDFVKYAAKIN